MKFALLGADPETLVIARAVAVNSAHQLVWASELNAARLQIEQFAPAARFDEPWETLLADSECDVVIVAGSRDDEPAADRLRKLVQAGKTLLVSHPVHPSMLVCYELDMIRQDTGAVILAYSPAHWHPAVARLRALFGTTADAPLGQLEQVVIERHLSDRSAENVRRHFARDAGLARLLGGELTRLSAMAPTSQPSGYANLGVQLSGPANILIRYSVSQVERQLEGRAIAIGSGGKAELMMPDEGDWTLDVPDLGNNEQLTLPTWDPGAAALTRIEQLVSGQAVAPLWSDSCREVELADSIQRSLDKGRTVELHYEDYTEDGTFKGTMTSVGCALLWLAPLVLVGGIALGKMGLGLADYVPHLLLGVLAIFLLLQTLRLVVPTANSKR
jgi:myo-inositol 2-dehydrogenase/D-chiro-inositol 1-dehydrogenase